MDRTTIDIGGSLSQQPISNVIQHSLTYLSFPQKTVSLGNSSSFSTYIRPDDHLNQVDDSEISIFDAQKYFSDCTNEAKVTNKPVSTVNVINLQHISDQPRLSSASSSVDGYGRNYRARTFNATPTASSEASWNSKTGLLSNPPGAIAISMRNPTTSDKKKRASNWLFGRKCPCSGKKSVQVEENLFPAHLYKKKQTQNSIEISSEKSNWIPSNSTENGFSSLGQQHVLASSSNSAGRPYSSDGTNGFTFPILNKTSPIKLRLNDHPLEDPPRESLEIFQPSSDSIKSIDQLQHRMTLMPRQSFAFPGTDDDVASDASSDLFEIESFSTQTTSYPMYNNHIRDSLDEASNFNARRLAATNGGLLYCTMSTGAATECYEPSEASIDWSVTTAEGFDRGSVTTLSEVDEYMMRHDQSNNNKNKGGGGGGRSKKGNGMLLSCRCEKAVEVSVGPNPIKSVQASSKPPIANSNSSLQTNTR
ncbi:hypothetical protein ACOSP7_028319 [Xanthoceras sorbifolium]